MYTNTNIVIIGAGAAGIAAASKLLESGFRNVTLLEAKGRIGGRIYTVDFADNIVDLGAQWVHGEEGNIVFNMVSNKSLTEFNNMWNFTFFDSKGQIVSQDETDKIVELFYKMDENEDMLKNSTVSYGEIVTRLITEKLKNDLYISKERIKQYLEFFHKYESSYQGSDTLFDVSAKRLVDYKTCPGDPLINWKTNGYKAILDLLMKKDSEKTENRLNFNHIKFHKYVENINYESDNEIIITTSDGEKINASHVIFTPSLGVLKERHLTLFKPILSESKKLAIENLGIGTSNKFYLEFPSRWWPMDMHRMCLLWSKDDVEEFVTVYGESYRWLCDVFYCISLPYQPRVLCAWIQGVSARFSESLPNNEILKQLYILLQRFLGQKYTISEPINIIRSTWYTDKCFRGSYSFKSVNTERSNVKSRDLAEPILNNYGKPILLFAGEATHDEYYSTVHGAIETGFREANRVISYYRLKKY